MDFLPHLEELRKRIITCLLALSAASVVCYFFSKPILDFLIWPLRQYSSEPLVFQKPYEAFLIHIKVALFSGLILSSPIIFGQLWHFLAPGLYEKEKKLFLPVVIISAALFVIGVLFGHFLVMPWGLRFMLDFQTASLKPLISAGSYFSFLIGMLLAFGVLFDFPVIIVGLVELGVVKTAALRESRRAIVVIIFIVAAVLTPSPDPISQCLLAFPLWGLFEISLAVAAQREQSRPQS